MVQISGRAGIKGKPLLWTGALLVGLLVLAASSVVPAFGQTSAGAVVAGRIFGSVKDPSGGVVPGASVIATNVNTGLQLKKITDASGGYLIDTVPPGDYEVEVTLKGFERYVGTGIHVDPRLSVRVDATLQVGAVTQTVEVTAAASPVNTFNNQLTTVVNSQSVTELPLDQAAM